MFTAASISEILQEKHHHEFSGQVSGVGLALDVHGIIGFEWDYLPRHRDVYVEHLNGIYEDNLVGSGTAMLHDTAMLERDGNGSGSMVVGVSPEAGMAA